MDAKALDALDPPSREVVVRGERLLVQPLTIGQIPKLIRHARSLVDELLTLPDLPEGDDAFVALALDLLDKHGDTVPQAAAIAIGRDADWVGQANPAEFLELATAIYEVNRDFFVKTFAPRLAALGEKFRAPARNGVGSTPASSSSNAATN